MYKNNQLKKNGHNCKMCVSDQKKCDKSQLNV